LTDPFLTEKEIRILKRLANRIPRQEIAALVGCGQTTFKERAQRRYLKFRVRNSAQLICLPLISGVLSAEDIESPGDRLSKSQVSSRLDELSGANGSAT